MDKRKGYARLFGAKEEGGGCLNFIAFLAMLFATVYGLGGLGIGIFATRIGNNRSELLFLGLAGVVYFLVIPGLFGAACFVIYRLQKHPKEHLMNSPGNQSISTELQTDGSGKEVSKACGIEIAMAPLRKDVPGTSVD